MPHILLLACYELGHQPLSLAWPTAVLQEAGFDVTAVDLSISSFPTRAAQQTDIVAIAVPMHTALRLGVQAAQQVRAANPTAPRIFYGMYAWLNRHYLLDMADAIADAVIAGEYEAPLLALAQAIANGQDWATVPGITTTAHATTKPHIARLTFPLPDRHQLPPLDQYARYDNGRDMELAGYVESTRGCLHTCRHCPVVPVYNGRFFVVPQETVLADIRQQVQAGAQHITFGDPDFLNGPGHARKIVRALHAEFPHVTFDFTTKVEHIIQHQHLLPEFAESGCTFIISAFESTSDRILARLHKGHTRQEMEQALALVADAGIAIQPTWLAFTPWTTLADYLHMLRWIREQGIVQHVPAVQMAVRLLVPPESAILDHPDVADWLGPLDAANFTYHWDHPDPCMDELHRMVTRIAEEDGSSNPYATFTRIEQAAYRLAGQPAPQWQPPALPDLPPPRLTEDWFC